MDELEAILETGGAAALEVAASAMAQRGGKTVYCPNCGQPMIGPFCALCGQSINNHRRSVGHLVADLVKDIASFDSRILRTAYAMLAKPGELALAFHEGRTQRYVPPVRLYLFVSLIFFVALSISHVALLQFVLRADPINIVIEKGKPYQVNKNGEREEMSARYADGKKHYTYNSDLVYFQREGSVHSNLSKAQLDNISQRVETELGKNKDKGKDASVVTQTVFGTLRKLADDPAALNGSLTVWIPRALFLLLPLFALLLAGFYWRQRKSLFFVDHLVFSLSFHSFGFALQLAAAALAQVIAGGYAVAAMVVVLSLYLLLAMKRFYRQSWRWTVLKWAAVSFIYYFFCVLPAFGLVIAAAVMWG
ncbi:ABC-type multidrug transport system fused ATPase/permease subunit [Rhizomicrobium palustre]|uniref:ABC-type multidrug transport system fused ATPase/permease subunit n=1 Tax=Rhizomicrobium palustre TaxID=189966 RepID=A0A846N182_9PROT|nr:DUF3667 domain-containing protein [Rhizomicrobium palustre]NIK89724.1 ABC-type multidrug transport system fused ATPase/permease subunit [Rhizomicrobium palustre]